MSSTVEYQSTQRGPVTFSFRSIAAGLQVVADPGASSVWVQLSAVDGDENAVKAIEQATFTDRGGVVELELDEGNVRGATRSGGAPFGGTQFGYQNVSFGNYSSNVVVNGATMVDGVMMGRIIVRAIVPTGTELEVNTTSGDVEAKFVDALQIRTVSGDIEATGLRRNSSLNTVSGDIVVSAAGLDERGCSTGQQVAVPGAEVRVSANSVSGDVTGYGVRLRAHTVSGRIRER